MKNQLFKLCAITLAVSSLTMGGCSQSASSDANAAKDAGNAPSMQDALSPEGRKAAADAALPKADTNVPLDQYTKVTSGNQLMFMYYALSNMPVDYEKIAERYSKEYRATSDGFKKQDILNALKPRIDAEIAKAKQQRYYVTENNLSFSAYDFNAKGFPVGGLETDSYRYFNDNSTYRYTFTNGDNFKMLKVTDEQKARQIEPLINKYPPLQLAVYAYAQDVDPSNEQIKSQIVKVKLLDSRGNELFSQ